MVFGGGIIPEADRGPLAELGVAQVFTPGATMADIVAWVRANVQPPLGPRLSLPDSAMPVRRVSVAVVDIVDRPTLTSRRRDH